LVGVMGAVYLTEFGGSRLATVIRFSADVLAGIPSIITGMVAYTMLVVPMKGFSALAGAVSLALIMIPIVLRTTEEQLKLVPGTLREASLALGVPLWRTTLKVTLASARTGIITGIDAKADWLVYGMGERAVLEGNSHAEMVYRGMAYQVAKEVGRAAVALRGKVDGIALTGGLAHSRLLTGWIAERVQWIAPVCVYPGEDELPALAEGALRVLRGEEEAREY